MLWIKKTAPWENPLIPRYVWLPYLQLWTHASSSFGSRPEMGQIHKQEFKSKLTFHTRVKMKMGFRSKRDFIFPSPANLVKMSKSAKVHLRFLELGHMSLFSETLWWGHAWFATSWATRMHKSPWGWSAHIAGNTPASKDVSCSTPMLILMRARADSSPGHSGCRSNIT